MNKKVLAIVAVCIILMGGFYFYEQKQYEKELTQLPNQEEVCGEGGGCSTTSTEVEFGYQTGMYIPNITLTDFEGNEYKLYDLMEGKEWFVLNLGVEWCGDCQRDKEKLDQYYNELPEEIGVASVYVDYSKPDNPEKTASYENAKADAATHEFPTYYDVDNFLFEAFNVKNTPTTIIIQGDGKIKCVASEMDMDKLLLPNTDEVVYPVPTQESYDAANAE